MLLAARVLVRTSVQACSEHGSRPSVCPWVPTWAGPAHYPPTRWALGSLPRLLGFGLQWISRTWLGSSSVCRDLHLWPEPRWVMWSPPLLSLVFIHWDMWFVPVTPSSLWSVRACPPWAFAKLSRSLLGCCDDVKVMERVIADHLFLGFLQTTPLQIKSMLKQLAIGKF